MTNDKKLIGRNDGMIIRNGIMQIIDEVKDYCRFELGDNSKRKLDYIEQVFNDKYADQYLFPFIHSILFDHEGIEPLIIQENKTAKNRDKVKTQMLNVITEEHGSVFSFCKNNDSEMVTNYIGSPWIEVMERLLDYHSDIEKLMGDNPPTKKELILDEFEKWSITKRVNGEYPHYDKCIVASALYSVKKWLKDDHNIILTEREIGNKTLFPARSLSSSEKAMDSNHKTTKENYTQELKDKIAYHIDL